MISIHARIAMIAAGAVLVIVGALAFVSSSPKDFPIAGVVNIPKNATLSEVAESLHRHSIIRSTGLFKIAALISGGKGGAMTGDYLFETYTNVWTVAYRVTHGVQGLARVKVTFPEGSTAQDVSKILADKIPGFAVGKFLALATSSEGYLFPDTYYFFVNVKPEEVVKTLRTEFDQKYAATLNLAADAPGLYGKSKSDIVTMASIVEKEAINQTDREIVAGVLWKRLAKGMLLQVDPPFAYFLGKSTDELTLDDLKVDSPYNTYLHKGLPAGPISNPGTDALLAAMAPTSTPYWFYLSDKKGVMHYAKTYDEHLTNRAEYLGK